MTTYTTNGRRPIWLADLDNLTIDLGFGVTRNTIVTLITDWSDVTSITLPSDHWAVPAIKAGYEPWAGGPSAPSTKSRTDAPDDWDGGTVLLRSGVECLSDFINNWGRNGEGILSGNEWHIIGYKRRIDTAAMIKEGIERTTLASAPLRYAQRLAQTLHAKHHSDDTAWTVGDDTMTVLTQIDNMTAGLTRHSDRDEATIRACIEAVEAGAAKGGFGCADWMEGRVDALTTLRNMLPKPATIAERAAAVKHAIHDPIAGPSWAVPIELWSDILEILDKDNAR